MQILDDTIAAIATAPGAGGLAVVRVSGARALAVADAVFRGAAALASAPSHTVHHGWAVWPPASAADGGAGSVSGPGEARARLDEVLATVFRAPRSYTREDVVELSCHGGELSSRRVLAALLEAGARLARPGEFTLRAFLNGRMDLAQAEAVAEVEARVDFAEDVGGVEVPPHVVEAIAAVDAALAELLRDAVWARAVREGVRVPLVGRPNVGKSSLFNALLGEARAIVTDTPGTTRDRVSETIELAGIRVTLSDTAGLRDTEDAVESIGVARAREALAGCAVAIWVIDGSAPLATEDRAIAVELSGKRVVAAVNKCDRPPATGPGEVAALLNGAGAASVAVSATESRGLDRLREALAEALGAGVGRDGAGGLGVAVGNRRHVEAMERSRAALGRAARVAGEGLPGEIVALELHEALAALGEVTGRSVGEDLLDRIFSKFCVGK